MSAPYQDRTLASIISFQNSQNQRGRKLPKSYRWFENDRDKAACFWFAIALPVLTLWIEACFRIVPEPLAITLAIALQVLLALQVLFGRKMFRSNAAEFESGVEAIINFLGQWASSHDLSDEGDTPLWLQ